MWLSPHYSWVLALVVVVPLAITRLLNTPRSRYVVLLRILGAAFIIGSAIWFVIGDVENATTSIHFTPR